MSKALRCLNFLPQALKTFSTFYIWPTTDMFPYVLSVVDSL
ncbi:hypothetical protein S7335_4049 [Synechococcus sp. PCC 7335]|nr:hypothetical protein S7335_4049 [Synechococcus sp. PCC 7335]